ncbi:MAG: translation initiation factor eIF-1A [Candidatus Poseidonia sp.]|nr:translation initiation factor eIF-1A [Poseidonia sp.]
MGRRHEEKVDVEELARLENPEGVSDGKIRVKMPNKRVNEMFALAQQILGGRRVTVLCADGETRMARIPGKMRRRQWVREGDLIIVWPWDFQDSKADVKHRYTKTQAMYLSRKGVLPDDVDMFGMGVSFDDDGEHDDLFSSGDISEEVSEVEEAAEEEDLFADDESDDLFADDADDEVVEESGDVEVEQEPAVVEEDNDDNDDDDDDDDIDALFA